MIASQMNSVRDEKSAARSNQPKQMPRQDPLSWLICQRKGKFINLEVVSDLDRYWFCLLSPGLKQKRNVPQILREIPTAEENMHKIINIFLRTAKSCEIHVPSLWILSAVFLEVEAAVFLEVEAS